MPELPEVEVTRLALAPHVEGQAVQQMTVRQRRLRWPVPEELPQQLVGQRVEQLGRRGKYLLWHFGHGTLISHLGMSGSWRVHLLANSAKNIKPAGTHDHVDIEFADCLLRLTDPRRFGALLWHAADKGDWALHPLLAKLGIEPFDPRFDAQWFYQGTRGRRASIKQVLLAGDIVVGVGNIYASESLFRAGISPRLPALRLSLQRCALLVTAIQQVLAAAIQAGGSSLRDFTSAQGAEGYFMREADVYDRADLPCRRCGNPIRRLIQGQRATYYCARCQRR